MINKLQRGFIFKGLIGLIASAFLFYLFWKIVLLWFLGLIFGGVPGGQNKLEVDPAAGGTVIGFFNGILVQPASARQHLNRLYFRFGDETPSGQPLQYQLFYNDSYGVMLDLVEAYYQRAGQIGLGERYDLFWGLLSGDRRDIDRVAGASSTVAVTGLAGLLFAGTTSYLKALSKSKEIKTSAEHRQIIGQLTGGKSRQNLLLVAHSQGNLYALPALAYASKRGKAAVSIIHVAPPTDTRKGGYVLSSQDVVINSLRRMGGRVPAWNVDPPPCGSGCAEPLGHGFAGVYFNLEAETGRKTEAAIVGVLR